MVLEAHGDDWLEGQQIYRKWKNSRKELEKSTARCDRLEQEVVLRGEEIRIKDGRMGYRRRRLLHHADGHFSGIVCVLPESAL